MYMIGALVTIYAYIVGGGGAALDGAILTESGNYILTESGNHILIES